MNILNRFRTFAFAGAFLALASFGNAQSVEERLAALEARCNTLQSQVNYLSLENSQKTAEIIALKGKTKFMSVSGATTIFTACNVQIKKDAGSYWTPNGLGNLIIGYNHNRTDGVPTARTGSHNLVLGNENNYTSVMGIVGGYRNQQSMRFGVILSGTKNLVTENGATSSYGVILTGENNKTMGQASLVGTGVNNLSQGFANFLSTGYGNGIVNWDASYPEYNFIGTGSNNKARRSYNVVINGRNSRAEAIFSAIGNADGIVLDKGFSDQFRFYIK